MAQNVGDPPEEDQSPSLVSHPLPGPHTRFSKAGIVSLLVMVGVLLLSFTGLLILNVSQGATQSSTPISSKTLTQQPAHVGTPTSTVALDQDETPAPPLYTPNNATAPRLQMPVGHYVLYEQQKNLYLVPATGGIPQLLTTPGYVYNQAVPPILTPSGQLLYSGDGLWLMDIFGGTATQIASLAPGQVVTSMALSSAGTMVAWSTAPIDSKGVIDLYAGPLTAPTVVYEQSAANCPCFRIFSFMNGPGKQGNTTLLLTDDRGSLQAIEHGLWALDITAPPPATPQPVLDEDPQQGPLALAPYGNTLLYSTNEGIIPLPTDASVPPEFASLTYANSLNLATMNGQPMALNNPQVLLPEQHTPNNSAVYHWVTTPVFSVDGQMLIYVEFTSDANAPYDRHSAIYTAQISRSGTHLSVGKPTLLATSTSLLLELGPWLNNHILTFFSDGTLFALDVQTCEAAVILQTDSYARIIAVVGTGRV